MSAEAGGARGGGGPRVYVYDIYVGEFLFLVLRTR